MELLVLWVQLEGNVPTDYIMANKLAILEFTI